MLSIEHQVIWHKKYSTFKKQTRMNEHHCGAVTRNNFATQKYWDYLNRKGSTVKFNGQT